jgi:hypothetical protein
LNRRIKDLQSSALPLGYVASKLERKTGFEPATLALARRCSTAELLPHKYYALAGAAGRNRTTDTRIFSPLLYRLSYRGPSSFAVAELTGIEPAISGLTGRHVNRYTTAPHIKPYQRIRSKYYCTSKSPILQGGFFIPLDINTQYSLNQKANYKGKGRNA